MVKVIVPLADGFEDIEAVSIIDILRRGGLEVVTVSLAGEGAVSAHEVEIKADKHLDNIDPSQFDAIVLPGGDGGMKNLRANQKILEIIREFSAAGKWTAAVCASPSVLGTAGILTGKKATCYPGYEENLTGADLSEDRVVVDGKVVTSRGPGTAPEFALKLVALFKNPETAQKLKKGMLYA